MRCLKLAFPCVVGLFVLVWLCAGQQQGPLQQQDPSQTVAKKKTATGNDTSGGGDAGAGTELPKIPSVYKKDKNAAAPGDVPTFKADVDIVTLDVAVVDNNGTFIPAIPAVKFRVLEDNVPQQIRKVELGEAPITVALLVEFSQVFQQLYSGVWFQTQQLTWGFASTMRKDDYLAIIAYDIKPEILCDFTTDRNQINEALHRLTIPAWREANMFDAVTDTADRMSGIEGRKAILLITSGIDTFSKITYDQARKSLQQSGVPVYSISLRGLQRAIYGDSITELQWDNELKTFAKETGGQAWFPRFEGEYGGIFGQVHEALRHQYVVTYSSSNKNHDGAFRKLKVDLVDTDGKPLAMRDAKGKPIKYQVIYKAGYKAQREVE
ncbi:MAG TPA: VWA domain-containing protein [Verrucomicrobiae bacterium]|nr:VWA domain-containing protein [Verrucomicrobiae bacterium]